MNAILIEASDNVVTLTEAVKTGETVSWAGGAVAARDDVPFGHKVAIVDLDAGAEVLKYGSPIGKLGGAVLAGALIHTQQLHAPGSEEILQGRE